MDAVAQEVGDGGRAATHEKELDGDEDDDEVEVLGEREEGGGAARVEERGARGERRREGVEVDPLAERPLERELVAELRLALGVLGERERHEDEPLGQRVVVAHDVGEEGVELAPAVGQTSHRDASK